MKLARGFIVLFGITFVNALIKTLVAESHNKDKVEVKHASFDLAMKNQVNAMNAQLPIRIDEYTICVEVSYTVAGGCKFFMKYRADDVAVDGGRVDDNSLAKIKTNRRSSCILAENNLLLCVNRRRCWASA